MGVFSNNIESGSVVNVFNQADRTEQNQRYQSQSSVSIGKLFEQDGIVFLFVVMRREWSW